MIYIVDNLWPILVATLAGLAAGAIVHALAGRAERRIAAGFVMTAFVAEFWFAAILAGALILAPAKANPWIMAVGTAVVIWIGFVVPALIVTLRYRGMTVRTVAVDCGHWLAVMAVEAAVLHAIGLRPPPA